jgi:signal transduction histidine kinase
MLRVYSCITAEHDIRLVVMAGIICFLACFTALSLFGRGRDTQGSSSLRAAAWLFAAATVAGTGVWATHFVAMLAFEPHLPVGYRHDLTIFSILTAVVISGAGFALALRGLRASLAGGALLGAGIGAMHYSGMAAMMVQARQEWDASLVVASIAIGVIFGAMALALGNGRPSLWRQLCAATLLTLAICGLHFTAMAAVVLIPDPTVPMPDTFDAPRLIAIGVAGATILIVAIGFASSVFDRYRADRSTRETIRLREYVAQLETTKKELEHTTVELKRALVRADEGSNAKTRFLATMSHELRTPLNAIIGFAELLMGEVYGKLGDPHYRDYAQDIHDSGKHLLGLINDVLDISKLDAATVETYREPTELPDLLRKTAQLMRPQAEQAGVTLVEAYDTSLPAMGTDERRLRQVLLNLLSNAVKFTPKGGKVTISAYRQGAGVAICIADTGIGIAPEDIPKAMENFGQVQSGWSRPYEGTGIGLPLAKRLVELLGGSFVLESAVGAGTNVIIYFPPERLLQERLVA